MTKHEALRQLRTLLVNLYPTVEDSVRVIEDAGLAAGDIRFDTKAINNWHAILAEADKRNLVPALIEVALRDYRNQSDLIDLARAYVDAKQKQTETPVTNQPGPDNMGEVDAVVVNVLIDEARRQRLTVFVGNDLPRPLTGVPGSQELAQELIARYQLPEQTAPSLPALAQQVAGRFRNDLIQFLRDRVETISLPPQQFDLLLAQLPVALFITTRYDDLLEKAFLQNQRSVEAVTDDYNASQRRLDRATLLKLYGDLRQPRTLTLTEDDLYDLASQKRGLVSLVEQTFSSNTVLFLGVDLDNPALFMVWREVIRRLGRDAPRAYAAVDRPVAAAEHELWRGRHIEIVEAGPLAIVQALAAQLGQ